MSTPLAAGFFVDNSIGKIALDPAGLAEPVTGYSADYGSLLGSINKRLAAGGQLMLANHARGRVSAKHVVPKRCT